MADWNPLQLSIPAIGQVIVKDTIDDRVVAPASLSLKHFYQHRVENNIKRDLR